LPCRCSLSFTNADEQRFHDLIRPKRIPYLNKSISKGRRIADPSLKSLTGDRMGPQQGQQIEAVDRLELGLDSRVRLSGRRPARLGR
jgi:hypothetical protein